MNIKNRLSPSKLAHVLLSRADISIALMLLVFGLSLFSPLSVKAQSFDVEDPYICKNTLANYAHLADQQVEGQQEQLKKAVVLHCQDDYKASADLMDVILKRPDNLLSAELTYSHILQSINLSFTDFQRACDTAKLAVAFATSGKSRALEIRAELGYYAFCDITDNNIAHALQRLYELSKEAIAENQAHLELAVHNQISYVYYNLDQNQLAADELEAALAISRVINADDYSITLFNLIDAYLDAGQLIPAEQRLTLFSNLINDNSSQFEHWLFYYAKSYHALLSDDYQQVVEYIKEFDSIEPIESPELKVKLASVQGLACFYLSEFDCVATLFERHFNQLDLKTESSLNVLKLAILWYQQQANETLYKQAQTRYFDVAEQKLFRQQQAAKVLGVAKLNNEVIQLNADRAQKQLIYQSELNQIHSIVIAMASVFILLLLTIIYRIRQKTKRRKLFK